MRNLFTSPMSDRLQSTLAMRMPAFVRPNVKTASESESRGPGRWLALTGILLAGNAANALSWRFGVPINTGVFSIALALGLTTTVGWSEWRRVRTAVVAWRPRWSHTGLAIAAGLALALPSAIFFAITSAHGGVGYSPIPALSVRSLLVRELIEIPLLTAVVEELVFRQHTFRAFGQRGLIATALINAGIFTLWHLVVTARTVLATHFSGAPLLLAGAYVGSLATIFVAGLVFALVRWRTGSFVYSTLTHWLVLGLITLAVWAL